MEIVQVANNWHPLMTIRETATEIFSVAENANFCFSLPIIS